MKPAGKIRKILIANRGEIALRIQRAVRELGMQSVAVFASNDRLAPFVIHSDEAYLLDGVSTADTYLNIPRILSIAVESGVDAIHPGYGFLSENAEFAEAVAAAGLTFIGPRPDILRQLGSKTSARELAGRANIPIVPGTVEPITDIQAAKAIAASIGFPILIKASGGGGGKGMRVASSPEEFENLVERASSEALKSFADARVYIEKFLIDPRHIEIQILADSADNVLHFGERECSIQRRHQKLIEECPSAILEPQLRQQMGEAAVRIARQCSYTGVGTVEFLLDKELNFYFLEVNTRIQVEHPITEMVYGIDLVKWQIEIAGGKTIPFTQDSIKPVGHAIECRICAEDPENGFLPSTGDVLSYVPSEGPGIRNDSGITVGTKVTSSYDPLLAKLIAWDVDRTSAIARMTRALEDYHVAGVKTTIPFCLWTLAQPAFVGGSYDINFIQKFFKPSKSDPTDRTLSAAGIALALLEDSLHPSAVTDSNAAPTSSHWKNGPEGWRRR